MKRGYMGLSWDLSAVMLSDTDDSGFLRVQPLGYGGQNAKVEAFELHHTFGFASRPKDPDVDGSGEVTPGGACTMFYALDGNSKHAVLSHDPRYVGLYPPLKKGGSAQYGGGGAFASIDGETSTWTLYVPYEFDGDGVATKAHVVTVGVDGNGTPIIELAMGSGASATCLDGVWVISSDSGATYLQLDDNGVNVVGPFKATSGADIGGAVTFAVVKMAEMVTMLTAIATAMSGMPAPSGGPVAATAITAAIGVFTGTGGTLFLKGA